MKTSNRIEELEIMRSNTEDIILHYFNMRHPNKQKFIAIYERNLQFIEEELEKLKNETELSKHNNQRSEV